MPGTGDLHPATSRAQKHVTHPRRAVLGGAIRATRSLRRWLAGAMTALPLGTTPMSTMPLAALPLVALPATSVAQPPAYNVKGHLPDLKFDLQGAGGTPVTQDALRGKVVLMFFGFANCPDICPLTMAQLGAVMQSLGPQAQAVRIVFVSVDPHRDTPDRLQAYVSAFDTRAIGLTGSERQIAALARRYRVSYQIEKPRADADAENYTVSHSRGIFMFDAHGVARWLISDGAATDAITQRVRALLPEGTAAAPAQPGAPLQ